MARKNTMSIEDEEDNSIKTLNCMGCGKEYSIKDFYYSGSELYSSICKIPYCKDCLDKFYHNYTKKYKEDGYTNPEKKAIERLCMAFNVYYSDKVFESAVKNLHKSVNATIIGMYLKKVNLNPYRSKDYDTTIKEKFEVSKNSEAAMSINTRSDTERSKEIDKAIKLFGSGFDDDDYLFLYDQYCDWVTRHECNTKVQEEIFKRICFTQLELFKATRDHKDTKNLTATFQNLLDSAKLQPKQNSNNAVSDAQTFGTLIDKWENTKPVPETDDELKDVDGIRLYTDVFFKGGLAKSLGLDIPYSKEYDEFMEQYTVNKPEYAEDDLGNNPLHEAIFGKDLDENSSD